ncbi:hypothetical protein LV457_08060 [Mycobacterium sp. MYCO198283]|uniref:hypothetical protein n=1 Tax=Mycobacterium sp. MYCO198283 TaxID=2883505 RepID=UPI001E295445|nr:hypothetical protein [Mycobacterium sp. MYCO198283]MCG5432246.1 hypothetical protein [Mycobacterium sp. MYCO198283]
MTCERDEPALPRARRTVGLHRAVVWLSVAALAAGCGLSSQRAAADALVEQLRGSDGVASVTASFTEGRSDGHTFGVAATFDRDVTVPQAQRAVADFVDGLAGFGEYFTMLSLSLPSPAGTDSRLKIFPGDGLRSTDATEATATLVDAVRTPSVAATALRVSWTGVPRRTVRGEVVLRPPLDDAALHALLLRHPTLQPVEWLVGGYRSSAYLPDAHTAALWQRVVAAAGPGLAPRGWTGAVPPGSGNWRTTVTIDDADLADPATVGRIEAVAAALPGFGRPVDLTVGGPAGSLEITVGGCRRHRPGHVGVPAESQLAARWERC